MFHLTLFSSTDSSLAERGNTALTIFGSITLQAPTLAQRIVRLARPARPSSFWNAVLGRDRSLMLTLFGSTDVALPSVLDEWLAMRKLALDNQLPREQVRALCDQLRTHGPQDLELATLTVFGTCRVSRPPPKREQATLERAEKAGAIDLPTRSLLQGLLGRGEPALIGGLADAALA